MSILCFAEEKKEAKVVIVEKTAFKNITQSVRLIGTIKAKKSTELTAKVTGTLDYIAHVGQKISKGDLIAKLKMQIWRKVTNYQLMLKRMPRINMIVCFI